MTNPIWFGVSDWFVFSGKTKAKGNNLARAGWKVDQYKFRKLS
jgi:hypothetical protein